MYLTYIKNGITTSELADILKVSLPRAVSVINSLELKKLIKKQTDNEDRRKTIISITEVGKELVLRKKEEAINKLTKVIEKLDEKDINEYIRLAKKVGKIMEEMQD